MSDWLPVTGALPAGPVPPMSHAQFSIGDVVRHHMFEFRTLLSLLDLFMPKKTDRRILGLIGLIGIVIAGIFVLNNTGLKPVSIMADMYRLDSFASGF